jgi:hypothetical protein
VGGVVVVAIASKARVGSVVIVVMKTVVGTGVGEADGARDG